VVNLPADYQLIALSPAGTEPCLRLALLVKTPEAPAPPFFLLRETPDASIYLGSLIDQSDEPKCWVEIAVQDLDHLTNTFWARSEGITNTVLDQRWRKRIAVAKHIDSFLDLFIKDHSPVPISQSTGKVVRSEMPEENLSLCTDESALLQAGLPSYGNSLHRYLGSRPKGKTMVFLPVNRDAPLPEESLRLAPLPPDVALFNPAGGSILVREFSPLSLLEFADLLGGKPWPGIRFGESTWNPTGPYAGLDEREAFEHRSLFSGRRESSQKLFEVLHLKLNLLQQMLSAVSQAIRIQQTPFLCLRPESFAISLAPLGSGLPVFWTSQIHLADLTGAIPLPVPGTEDRYFIPAESGQSIYRPDVAQGVRTGGATLRIRAVLPPSLDGTSIEATVTADERLLLDAHDLVRIRLVVPAGRVEIFGRLSESESSVQGELRFRSLPQHFPEATVQALTAEAGALIHRVPLEIIPLLSSPFDLHSVAVLGARILLVDGENSLPIVLDELRSLGHALASDDRAETDLVDRLLGVAACDERWFQTLGPHRLSRDPALRKFRDLIPPELWWTVIGFLIRLFPKLGPDSFCPDLGAAPPLALEQIFQEPIEQLALLQLRARSLLLLDWAANEEVLAAITLVRAGR
jgi:hypothetical protein